MKLYEIDYKIRELWNKIIEQDGELTEEDIQTLESLEVAKDEKVKAYGVIIRELDGEIDDCEGEIKRIKEIADKRKRNRERLKNTLKEFMLNNDMPKYESVEVNISFRKSKALEIQEGVELPNEFLKVKTEPDKTAITDYIKNGGVVEGCQIVEKSNIQIK